MSNEKAESVTRAEVKRALIEANQALNEALDLLTHLQRVLGQEYQALGDAARLRLHQLELENSRKARETSR